MSITTTLTEAGYETTMTKTAMAQMEMGTDGNPLSLVAPDGSLMLRQTPAEVAVAIGGDSISEINNYATGVSVSIVSPGIARMTFSPALNSGAYWPGDEIKVTGATDITCNTMSSVVTAVDPSRLWVEYALTPSLTNAVVATPVMYRKYANASMSYLVNAFAQRGLAFRVSVDASIGGGDSEQVNELLVRDWATSDVAIYACGMNDVYARGWTFEQIKANDIANLAIMRRAKKLILMTIPPRYNGSAGWTAGKFAVWRKVNEWRRQYAPTIGADFLDVLSAELGTTYADPLNAYSSPRIAGTTMTSSDGVHPIGLGGTVLGALVALPLASIPAANMLPTSVALNSAEGYIFANPLLQRAGAGVPTGTATFQNLAGVPGGEVADNCTLSASSVGAVVQCGVVARTKAIHGDSIGYAQRVIIDNTAGASTLTMSFSTTSLHASIVDGDSLDYGAHVLLSAIATPGTGNPVGVRSFSVGFTEQRSTGAGNKFAAAIAGDNGSGYLPGLSVSPVKRDKLRTAAVAGALDGALVGSTVIVPVGASCCVDVGRVLARRVVAL